MKDVGTVRTEQIQDQSLLGWLCNWCYFNECGANDQLDSCSRARVEREAVGRGECIAPQQLVLLPTTQASILKQRTPVGASMQKGMRHAKWAIAGYARWMAK